MQEIEIWSYFYMYEPESFLENETRRISGILIYKQIT